MLQIQVTAYNELPPPERLTAELNEMGGSIGRAVDNALVLPDPERHISRTHATVMYRGGKYVIRDLGTAVPVYVNGQALGNGREAPIKDGDEIRIGGYRMRVAGKSTVAPKVPTAMVTNPPVTGAKPAPVPKSSAVPPSKGLIPDDFDPFADPRPAKPEETPLGEDLNIALGPKAAERSIDQLFGLGPGSTIEPFGSSDSDGPLHAPGASEMLDPMVALGATPAPQRSAAPQRDDTPEIHRAFRPPGTRPEHTPNSPPPKVAPSSSSGQTSGILASDSFGVMLSWEHPDGGGQTEIVNRRIVPSPQMERAPSQGKTGQAGSEQAPSASMTPATVEGGERVQARIAPQSPASGATAASVKPGGDELREELLRAFLAGAGIANLDVSGGLTPGMMTRVGQLLREATQGTLDLLLARALTKREVRADVTMITARDNNPLKFSPSVEVALAQLLAPQERGFMPPLQAMRDAYDDLRSHQFGFMAGMRAALNGTLERLNPEHLEQRLKQKSVIDSLLPMNRKAKLWDLFAEYYADIAEEAEEDFHALFGKEFLRAYEAQIAKLAKKERNRDK